MSKPTGHTVSPLHRSCRLAMPMYLAFTCNELASYGSRTPFPQTGTMIRKDRSEKMFLRSHFLSLFRILPTKRGIHCNLGFPNTSACRSRISLLTRYSEERNATKSSTTDRTDGHWKNLHGRKIDSFSITRFSNHSYFHGGCVCG